MTTKPATTKPAPSNPAAKTKASGKAAPAKKPPGRPSAYTESVAAKLCAYIADGFSLRKACEQIGMPSTATVMRWLADESRPEFREQYAGAREAQADLLAEQILVIADDTSADTFKDEDGFECTDHEVIARSRLRVDARKWLASKMAPKRYGDKIEATHTGPNGGPIQARIAVEFVRPRPVAEDDE